MDAIAEAASVTKRTVYYHFESKDALTAAVLERQNRYALAQIQEWGNSSSQTPEGYLIALFDDLKQWASQPRWLGSGFTRLTVELAHFRDHPVRRAADQHKHAVEDWLGAKLQSLNVKDSKEQARHVMLLIEGCMSLILIHHDVSYADSAAQAAVRLLEVETS